MKETAFNTSQFLCTALLTSLHLACIFISLYSSLSDKLKMENTLKQITPETRAFLQNAFHTFLGEIKFV